MFCDDLSFDEGEPGYKALKSILDGSVSQASDNVLIYATSNRRHLLPEYMKENLTYQHTGERRGASGRGGRGEDLAVRAFRPVGQLSIRSRRTNTWPSSRNGCAASAWSEDCDLAAARQESLVWALERGSRSGRVAFQFAKDYSGRHHA